MSIYGAADTQFLNSAPGYGYGGGFGGWGGGFGGGFGSGFLGGILGGALFGGRGGLFGGNNCGCGCNPCKCGNGGHHSEQVILEDAHYNSLQGAIGGVKDNIYALGTNIGDKFAATNAAIANVNYNQAINTKDIIHDIDIQSCGINHNIDKSTCATNANIAQTKFELTKQLSDCCCQLEKDICNSTQTILNKLASDKEQELLFRLAKCEKENDLFRWNNVVANTVAANFRATTVGSNFNTGTQTQSTSNNSGQIVG